MTDPEELQVGQRWEPGVDSSSGVIIVGTCGKFPEYEPNEQGMLLVESVNPPPRSVQPWRISEKYLRMYYPHRR
jgi:hypothetical protein